MLLRLLVFVLEVDEQRLRVLEVEVRDLHAQLEARLQRLLQPREAPAERLAGERERVDLTVPKFKKVMPTEYRRALLEIAAQQKEGA